MIYILKVFFFIIIQLITFSIYASPVDGVWVEAARGCNLSLDINQINKLKTSGGSTYLAKTIFIMNDDAFEIYKTPGEACFEDPSVRDIPMGYRLQCGSVSSSGKYSSVGKDEYQFDALESNGHSYGKVIKSITITIENGALKLSHQGFDCFRIKYFIPYPMS